MTTTWAINGTALAALGLEFAGGTFNTGTRSIMTLRRVADMDAPDLLPWGTPVVLTRNGTPFFQGKVNSLPTSANGTSEGQDIEIVDAWQDLEETIYKEEWKAGSSGTVKLPIAILGRKSNGADCTDAEQIQEAVNYAADNGVALQMGSIPAGLPLWQSEVRNVSCAEVVRLSLRFHPDWVPWIDHTTTPPTLNFTPRASLSLRTIHIGAGETESIGIKRRDDLKPDSVELLYLTATNIDGETFRDWQEDVYPDGASTNGPRVISNIIELAGGQMQFQKQRIKTRPLPTNHENLRTWLKRKYPELRDVPAGHWDARLTAPNQLIPATDPDDDPDPEPINPRARKLGVDTAEDLPRELVSGSIEDWMRRKVGQVRVSFSVRISPAASSASRRVLESLAADSGRTTTATNAITKIYKGMTQWVDREDAPRGIAAAIYNSLSAYQYEGSITTVMEDVSGERFHGCKLNITGGKDEWASMNAMVHSVSFDIASGKTTVSVGPAPFLSAEDMLELQRLLRGRKVTWMSDQERTSKELGADSSPGSKGDTVGGYDGPKEEIHRGPGGRFRVSYDSFTQRLYVTEGRVVTGPDPEDDMLRGVMPTLLETDLDEMPAPFFEIGGLAPGEYDVVCSFKEDKAQIFVMQDGEVKLGQAGEGEGGEEENEGPSNWVLSHITLTAGASAMEVTIDPVWLSDIAWQPLESSSGSESSESGPESSGGPSEPSDPSGPDDGSSKDSAIVPAAWSRTGYAALYTVEAPDVRFEEVMEIRLTGRTTRRKIDRRYLAVCESNTLRACSVAIDKPVAAGVEVEGEWVIVRVADFQRPLRAVVKLTGIRRGFLGTRFGVKTREQFEANERRLKGI